MIDTLEKTPDLNERIASAYEFQLEQRSNGSPSAFRDLRERAAASFDTLGIPTRKHEAWKYTNIEKALRHDYAVIEPGAPSDLDAADVADLRISGFDAYTLIVVNGTVAPHLGDANGLPAGITVESLRDAAESDADAVATYFGKYADVDADAFVALNTQFDLDGVFLRVDKGVTLDRPIQIIHVTDADEDALLQTRNLYVFGENSEALVVETYHSTSDVKTFGNRVSEIVVGRAARINVLQLQTESEQASQVNTVQVYQEAQSYFAAHTYTLGGALVRNNVNAVPNGEGCETHLYGLYIVDGTQHVDNHTLVDHAKPNCFSNELYRGIIDGKATGVFNGKVFVRRDAQQTNAYQSSQGVVLSDDAHHYSKPELEIYADDVKCSHGSTTGELEPEHVFYLRSRGLSERQAKALLLYAFAHDIVEELPHAALRTYLDGLIDQQLSV
ncbi:MAG: Fe-S cluster assembly protein SufD [Rhodothermales bacterium]